MARTLLVCLVLLGAAGYVGAGPKPEVIPTREPLDSLPLSLGAWQGVRAPDFDARTVSLLGADDYISRLYVSDRQRVGLYVGYYRSQREGDVIHSPMNCLPGAGWQPVETGRVTLDVPDATGAPRRIEVNRVVIQKGEDRQVVLYWYQNRGRVVASEYWGKFYLVLDAIRLNRTDAALVRVMAPIERHAAADVADRHAAEFVTRLFARLAQSLPA